MATLGDGFAARRYQAIASLILLAVLLGTCVATDLLARNRSLERATMAASERFDEQTGKLFLNTGNFIDFEERVLLDEIPNADYTRGGVYFFGTSNMKWAFTTWDLPAELSQLIGNYGIGASSHTTQLQFIQYLIKRRGLLTAGDLDLVVLGVSFHLARPDPPTGFFASLLRRHGLYTITPDRRIASVPMSAAERWLRIEKARSGGFIRNLGRLAVGWVAARAGWSHDRRHDAARYQQDWREFMGPQWRQNMDVEVGRLTETILLLRSHHAQVNVMLLPQGTWMDELPFGAPYAALIRAVCQSTSTPLLDLSRAMPDDAFVDSNHLTVDGQSRFRNMIMGLILEHLRKAGIYSTPPHLKAGL